MRDSVGVGLGDDLRLSMAEEGDDLSERKAARARGAPLLGVLAPKVCMAGGLSARGSPLGGFLDGFEASEAGGDELDGSLRSATGLLRARSVFGLLLALLSLAEMVAGGSLFVLTGEVDRSSDPTGVSLLGKKGAAIFGGGRGCSWIDWRSSSANGSDASMVDLVGRDPLPVGEEGQEEEEEEEEEAVISRECSRRVRACDFLLWALEGLMICDLTRCRGPILETCWACPGFGSLSSSRMERAEHTPLRAQSQSFISFSF